MYKDGSHENRQKGTNLGMFQLYIPVEIGDKLAALSRQSE